MKSAVANSGLPSSSEVAAASVETQINNTSLFYNQPKSISNAPTSTEHAVMRQNSQPKFQRGETVTFDDEMLRSVAEQDLDAPKSALVED